VPLHGALKPWDFAPNPTRGTHPLTAFLGVAQTHTSRGQAPTISVGA